MIISANLATYSGRKDLLPKVIRSLQNQTVPFDEIRIYSNDYLPEIEGATVTTGKDLTDKGKFYWLDKLDEPNYYFSMDDDIFYPPTYVEQTLQRLHGYPECIVTYHGRRLKGKGLDYYYHHDNFHCLRDLKQDTIIDIPGTGVAAFDTKHFRPDVLQYDEQKMVDVLVALEAAEQGVDVVCLEHSMWWLKMAGETNETIFNELNNDCQRQTELCDKIFDIKY